MGWTEVRQRALALGLGMVLTGAGLWLAAVVLILGGIAAQGPDPSAPDYGDPCCPVPDSWLGVAGWSVLALTVAAVDAGLLAWGVTLLFFALRGRRPRRRVGLAPLVVVPAAASLIVLGHIANAMS